VTYRKGRNVEEQKSLVHRMLLDSSSPSFTRRPHAATAALDNLYLQILEISLEEPRERDDPAMFEDCLVILRTFLCTIEHTSTSVAVDILNVSNDHGDALLEDGIANGILHRLHAVLYNQGGQVMSYQKSFGDSLFGAGRSQIFNLAEHHRRLAHGCFGVMMKQVRFNIANIPTSFLMDHDNLTLKASVETIITTSLRYAGRSSEGRLSGSHDRTGPHAG
jgi:hypothetical protein